MNRLKLSLHFLVSFAILAFGSMGHAKAESQKTTIRMAITVDDLPSHGIVPAGISRLQIIENLLSTFDKHKLSEVYGFVNGERTTPDLTKTLKLWIDKGNFLGNHTYSHLSLTKNSANAFIQDIIKNEQILKKYSAGTDFKFFRFPFLQEGNTLKKRNLIRAFLSENDYAAAPVTVSYDDYEFNPALSRCMEKEDATAIKQLRKLHQEYAVRNLRATLEASERFFGRQIKHVLLIHVGLATSLWFDDVIQAFGDEGVAWSSLQEVLRDPAYAIDPGVPYIDGGRFLLQVARSRKADFDPAPGYDALMSKLESMCR